VGIKAQFDHDEKKVFVSAIFGGYDILNNGVEHKGDLAVKYNTKSKKLKYPDARACKNCESAYRSREKKKQNDTNN
jgi:hypothetical protein